MNKRMTIDELYKVRESILAEMSDRMYPVSYARYKKLAEKLKEIEKELLKHGTPILCYKNR